MAATPRSSSPRVDCVVVGAGVVGASVAQQLARRGVTVTVIDRAPRIGGGCSYANAAILAPHHVGPLATPALLREAPLQMVRRPPAVRVRPDRGLVPWLGKLAASARRAGSAGSRLRELALESTDLHRQLAAEGLNPTLRKTGAVDVYLRQPRSALSGLLSFERLKQIEPLIEDVVAGTHDTEEWTVESRSFVKAMLDDAVSHGADVLFGTPVERLVAEGGRVIGVDTPAGAIFADHVVLAAGLQSAALAAHVGLNLPLRGGRGHVVDVELPRHGIPTMPVRIKEHRVVVTPLEDRVRVCGSLEFGRESRRADPRRGQALLDIATRVLPVLRDQPVIERWSGERPCTADGVPLIGPSRWVKNLWVATGHGMWGMILAPITGRHVAAAIVEGSSLLSDGLLNPDRFTRSNGAAWGNAS